MKSTLPVVGVAMVPVLQRLRVFARQEETLLLTGPTGVGKSQLARWCHDQSRRGPRVFETLSLLGVPEELQLAFHTLHTMKVAILAQPVGQRVHP